MLRDYSKGQCAQQCPNCWRWVIRSNGCDEIRCICGTSFSYELGSCFLKEGLAPKCLHCFYHGYEIDCTCGKYPDMIKRQVILDREIAEVGADEKAMGFDVEFLMAGIKNSRGGKKTLMYNKRYKGKKEIKKYSDQYHPGVRESKKNKNYKEGLSVDSESEWITQDYHSKRKLLQRNKKQRKPQNKLPRLGHKKQHRKIINEQNQQRMTPDGISRRRKRTTTITNDGESTIFTRLCYQNVWSGDFPEQWPNRPSILSKCPTAVYLETDPLPHDVDRIIIRTDHRWPCRVALCVSPPSRAIDEPIQATLREIRDLYQNSEISQDKELATVVRPGSVLRLILINAPKWYRPCCMGWCRYASLAVRWNTNSKRYHASATRELLIDHIAREEELTVDNKEQDKKKIFEKILLFFIFHDAPKGVFSNIIQFAFC